MSSTSSNSSKKRPKRIPFPKRLFQLLKLAEENGWEDIISWVDDGKGFKVHDRERFEKIMLAKYFGTARYSSFTRQLHAYDFDCVRTGRHTGIYSHPSFTRDNPESSISLKREASKLNSKQAISKNKNKGIPVADLQLGIRAGDTIVQFPTLLSPMKQDDESSLSSTSESSSGSQSPTMTGMYRTIYNRIADQTRKTLIRIPPTAPDSPFQNPENAFWSLSSSRFRSIGDVSSQQPNHQSPTITNTSDGNRYCNPTAAHLNDGLSSHLHGTNGIVDDAFVNPCPSIAEADEDDDDDFLLFDDMEPIPWSPAHASAATDDGLVGTAMNQSTTSPCDSSILEPRPIQSMMQNPDTTANDWWYDSAPMFDTPRKRAMLELSFPLTLPLAFSFLNASKFGIGWATFLILGHFVQCSFTAWGGAEDRNDKTYTKDFNPFFKPVLGMLQHHMMDLLWIHSLMSNMMLTPEYFGPPCFALLYLFIWIQPINLSIVIKTHYCESNLEGTYAHEKYWIGDLMKKIFLGYTLTALGVFVMRVFEMANYLRVPLVFGFNLIPLLAFESYRCMLSMSAVKNGTRILAAGAAEGTKMKVK